MAAARRDGRAELAARREVVHAPPRLGPYVAPAAPSLAAVPCRDASTGSSRSSVQCRSRGRRRRDRPARGARTTRRCAIYRLGVDQLLPAGASRATSSPPSRASSDDGTLYSSTRRAIRAARGRRSSSQRRRASPSRASHPARPWRRRRRASGCVSTSCRAAPPGSRGVKRRPEASAMVLDQYVETDGLGVARLLSVSVEARRCDARSHLGLESLASCARRRQPGAGAFTSRPLDARGDAARRARGARGGAVRRSLRCRDFVGVEKRDESSDRRVLLAAAPATDGAASSSPGGLPLGARFSFSARPSSLPIGRRSGIVSRSPVADADARSASLSSPSSSWRARTWPREPPTPGEPLVLLSPRSRSPPSSSTRTIRSATRAL